MLDVEHEIAEQKHHRRAYDELLEAWRSALAAAAPGRHEQGFDERGIAVAAGRGAAWLGDALTANPNRGAC
jgi:hypothetical protein